MLVKILQVVDFFGPHGGLERFIYELSRRLMDQGDDVLIAALDMEERHDWGKEPVRTEKIHRNSKLWMEYVRDFRPDLVLWHAGPATAVHVERLTFSSVPVAAVVHGPVCPSGVRLFRDRDEICTFPSGPACLMRWYSRRCGTRAEPWGAVQAVRRAGRMVRTLRACRRVYTVSDSLRGLLAIEGIEEKNMRVFDNTLGAAAGPFPPLRAAGWQDSLRLLFVGRVVYSKGAQYFLEAMRQLVDRNVPVDGTIIGDGWYLEKLRRRCRELGLERRVRFAGQVPGMEMDDWYDQSDVVVVPSIWPEPAGLVVPEARRRGKPVAVFDSGGLAEWTSFMDGIYVARHADASHLADKIVEAAVGRKEYQGYIRKRLRTDLIADMQQWASPSTGKETMA